MNSTAGPLLLVCGLACVWPSVLALAGFYVGRHGLPFEIRRRSSPPASTTTQAGDWLKGNPRTPAAERYADD